MAATKARVTSMRELAIRGAALLRPACGDAFAG